MGQTKTESLGKRLLSCVMAVVLTIGLMPTAPYQAAAAEGGNLRAGTVDTLGLSSADDDEGSGLLMPPDMNTKDYPFAGVYGNAGSNDTYYDYALAITSMDPDEYDPEWLDEDEGEVTDYTNSVFAWLTAIDEDGATVVLNGHEISKGSDQGNWKFGMGVPGGFFISDGDCDSTDYTPLINRTGRNTLSITAEGYFETSLVFTLGEQGEGEGTFSAWTYPLTLVSQTTTPVLLDELTDMQMNVDVAIGEIEGGASSVRLYAFSADEKIYNPATGALVGTAQVSEGGTVQVSLDENLVAGQQVVAYVYDEAGTALAFSKPVIVERSVSQNLGEGDYTLTYKMYKSGTAEASHTSAMFDPKVKLTVDSSGNMTLSLLSIAAYNQYTGGVTEYQKMINGLAIDGTKQSSRTVKADEYVDYTFTNVTDITKTLAMAALMASGGQHGGDTATEDDPSTWTTKWDMVFDTLTEGWEGFDSETVILGTSGTRLEHGTSDYQVPVILKNASNLSAASMAADVIKSPATISVSNSGEVTATVELQSMFTMGQEYYLSALPVYQAATATGDVVNAQVVESDASGNPTKVTFTVPSAAYGLDGVYVQTPTTASAHAGRVSNAFLEIDYANKAQYYRTLPANKITVKSSTGKGTDLTSQATVSVYAGAPYASVAKRADGNYRLMADTAYTVSASVDGYEAGTAAIAAGTGDIDSDVSVELTPTEYEISYDLAEEGAEWSTKPTETTYTVEDEITLPAAGNITAPKSEDATYTFDGWYLDDDFTTAQTKVEAGSTGDKSFTAAWKKAAKQTDTTKTDGDVTASLPSLEGVGGVSDGTELKLDVTRSAIGSAATTAASTAIDQAAKDTATASEAKAVLDAAGNDVFSYEVDLKVVDKTKQSSDEGYVVEKLTEPDDLGDQKLTLTFFVGIKYTNMKANVYHIHTDDSNDTSLLSYETVVDANGNVVIDVDRLSSFTIAIAVNKDELTSLIGSALNDEQSTAVAADAANVAKGAKYVTQADVDALNAAIAAAQQVAEKADATQADVTAAVSALQDAIDAFDAAKKDGAKAPVPAVTGVTMYRLYNPNSGEHLYTSSAEEYSDLGQIGWRQEGKAWMAPKTSSVPVYRLYNPNEPLGDHHYTIDKGEYDHLCKIGWKGEGIGWYSDPNKAVGLHRLYNPNAYPSGLTGAHHYTASAAEKNYLVSIGWQYENFGWYGLK